MSLKIEEIKNDNKHTLKLIGELDIETYKLVENYVSKFIEEKEEDLFVDGESLDFIDSMGLGVLITVLKKVNEKNKDIYISNLKPSIKKLFFLTNLDKLFKMEE